ncbi:MAG: xylulokinase [Thermodesulfobacteriota bacterium]
MARYFLGIDSGTQSTKALLVDENGAVAGEGRQEYGLIEGLGTGHKEQDPRTWIEAVTAAAREAVRDAGVDARQIAAMGVSGQQHGFVPLDAAGQVIRPAKLWCDTATAAQAGKIIGALGGPDAMIALTGNSLPAGFTASKILYMKEREPENYERLATVLLPHDYINFWLTGERRMEWGDASGTGLLDIRSRQFSRPALDAVDPLLDGRLPGLFPSREPCGRLRAEAADALGLDRGVLVSAGGGDNMMGAIGTGNVRPGIVTASIGTSGTIYAFAPSPIIDPGGEIAAFCDSTGHWLPLLCVMNATVATGLVKRLFNLSSEELNARAAGVPPGSDGLMLIPYFEGERVPDVPEGSGVWFGQNGGNATPAHFARAAMEGVVLGMGYGLSRLKALGIRPTEIRLTGGGGNSPVWRQIMADVFQTGVVCTTQIESAAFGAAIQAAWTWHRETSPDAAITDITDRWVALDESTRCTPLPCNKGIYEDMQSFHNRLSRTLRDLFPRHRRLFSSVFRPA